MTIQPEADPVSMSTAFFVHAGCTVEKLGEIGLLEKLEPVSDKLDDEDVAQLRAILTGG